VSFYYESKKMVPERFKPRY